MFPAVFSRTYPYQTLAEVFSACRDDGFEGIQFNLSSTGLATLPEVLPEHLPDEIKLAAGTAGLEICAVSATYNMAHPDAAYRLGMREKLARVVTLAQRIGSPVVTVCTGSRDAADMWRSHPDNASESAWTDMRTELVAALEIAESADVRIGVEPEPANVICDARAARRLLNELASDHLGVVLDAANLCVGMPAEDHRAVLDAAFDLVGEDIVLAHAKNIDAAGQVVPPGSGIVDLQLFAGKLSEIGYDRGLIGHGFAHEHTRLAARCLTDLCRGQS